LKREQTADEAGFKLRVVE